MDFSKLIPVISSIAPTLATMLGGPLAGTAVAALTSAFGLTTTGTSTGDTGAITQVIQSGTMTPEIIAQVRVADQAHAEKLKQADIDLVKINAAHEESLLASDVTDRVSARDREAKVGDKTARNLAYLVSFGFFGLLFFFLYSPLPSGSEDTIKNMISVLGTVWVGIMTYYFGSSSGSAKKTEIMAAAVQKQGA